MCRIREKSRNLVQFAKSLFRVDTPAGSERGLSDGHDRKRVVTSVQCGSNGNVVCIETFRGDRLGLEKPLPRNAPKRYSPKRALTQEQAREIRKRIHTKEWTVPYVAETYKVTRTCVYNLLKGKTYKRELPRTLAPRLKMCRNCSAYICDTIDGKRMPLVLWRRVLFCSQACRRFYTTKWPKTQ